jgi:ribosomal protein S12 methylthiotransferase accessory factor
LQSTGEWPTKVPLNGLPEELEKIVSAIENAGLFPFLFDITTTLNVPVFGCALFDTNPDGAGTFGGYGCSLNPSLAAKRALLEACQSRLGYISGARDDMYRRDFLLLKKVDQKKAIGTARLLPSAANWSESVCQYGNPTFETIHQELTHLLSQLQTRGIFKIYTRTLGEEHFGDSQLVVVRVITPQLEALKFDSWASNGRATQYVKERINRDLEKWGTRAST